MKGIEVQKLISEYLENNSIYLKDMLNYRIRIESYESFVELMKTTQNTYKDKIEEFENECKKYLDNMKKFIDHCKEINPEEVKREIDNEFKRYLINDSYSNEKSINTIFISSLNNTDEKCESALTIIYKELGYEKLKNYIELLKNPSLLTSYLNDSAKQIVAMHYFLFKTGHHSNSSFVRNTSTKTLYNMMKEDIDDSIKSITSEKQDFVNFMNNEKENYTSWKENANIEKDKLIEEYDNFMEECNERIENLENLYNKKLKVEKPAEFMKEKSEEYLKSSKKWAFATIFLVVVLLIILGLILSPKMKVGKKVIEISLFSVDIPIYQSIILLAMVCLIIYVIRVFIKLTLSSKHLSEEYKQKYILTYFYLSLISEGKLNDELGNSILSKLFTKADTGLIKSDPNIEVESFYKALTSINK